MKAAVTSHSGNVGKTTISRHCLLPHVPGAALISVENINADDGQGLAPRSWRFAERQEYLQAVDAVIVDIGASNVEELPATVAWASSIRALSAQRG